MKKTKTNFTIREAEAYLRKEGFKKLTKKQCEEPEWKQSIDSSRRLLEIGIV